MILRKKIRVLIVDDSLVFREIIAKGISTDIEIEVVATASDPYDARDKIMIFKPDVMTCDIEMPKMNGIEFIQRLMPQYPLPIIVVSSMNGVVFDALNSGAVEFVAKPDANSVISVEVFIKDMIRKIKIAAASKIPSFNDCSKMVNNGSRTYKTRDILDNPTNKIIVMGASTGGTEAIFKVLKALPDNMPGIAIVQHIPPNFSRMFAERLNSSTNLKVKEANTGDYLETGKVLIAPGDQHMMLRKIGERYKVECYYGEKVNGHCPSVDVLFDSAAKEVGNNAIGVIMTGMGYDGAKGLLLMKRKGAYTIGQDESSSVVYGMPKVAYNLGAVTKQVSLENIPQLLISLLR